MGRNFYLTLAALGIVFVIAAFLFPFKSPASQASDIALQVDSPARFYEQASSKLAGVDKLAADYTVKSGQQYAPEFNISAVKFGGFTKTVLASAGGSAVAYFMRNGTIATCSEFFERIDCSMSGLPHPPYSEILNVNLSGKIAEGTKVYDSSQGSRPCYRFSGMKISDSSSLAAFGHIDTFYSSKQNVQALADVCIDKEFGFVSRARISYFIHSRLSNSENLFQTAEISLNRIRMEVGPEDVEIPVSFGVSSVRCDGRFVNITISPFMAMESAEFDVNVSAYDVFTYGYKAQLINKTEISMLEYGKNREIIIPVRLSMTSYDVEICSEGRCHSKSCYVENPVQPDSFLSGDGCIGTDSKPICVSLTPEGYVKITNGYPKSFNTSEFAVFVNLDTEPNQRGCVWSAPVLEVGSSVTCDFAGNRCFPGDRVSVAITNSSKPPVVINC